MQSNQLREVWQLPREGPAEDVGSEGARLMDVSQTVCLFSVRLWPITPDLQHLHHWVPLEQVRAARWLVAPSYISR
jgi:hypothetical protein